MAESIVSDLVGRLLGYLGEYAIAEIASYFGGKRKLNQLEVTMKMIQARLHDAERSQEDEAGAALVKQWLKQLKGVLYRLEDLFEEVSMTDDDQNQQRAAKGLTKRVCSCILKLGRLKMNKMVNTEAEAIMRDLGSLTTDMDRLNLRVHPIQEQRAFNLIDGRETDSFVPEEEVIGRGEDKNKIVQMLFAQDLAGEGVSVIPIVGIGGLGKTTLAQLAYNDINVQQHFDLKCWACISDISSFEEFARKVLKSINGADCLTLSIQQIQSGLRQAVKNKRYLLVLDDVWDEDLDRWLRLRSSLGCGKQGSKIIVTSRSKVVALNMGTVEPYELQGLTEEESWELFKNLAFRQRQEERNPNLSSIGREIVKKCVNVPLAIRTLAGILRSKDTEEEWMLFKDIEISKLGEKENKIMSTLKLSYDYLPSRLKQCFAYCSLFPKDYEFDKQRLIKLWICQGFVQPLDENQSPFDVGHTYFMELLRRCFFQDVKTSAFNVTKVTCKMHDLVHDLACRVGDECLLVDRSGDHNHDDKNIRHLHFEFMNVVDSEWKAPSWLLASQQVRSLLLSFIEHSVTNMNNILSGMRSLRALDFGSRKFDSLPKSVAELKHLRYLRICVTFGLPNWITRLQNLQTLELVEIGYIEENEFPPGFGELKSLQALNRFTVGENNGLNALASMKLTGELKVYYKKSRPNEISEAREANLQDKKLTSLVLQWPYRNNGEPITEANELIKCLQPPPTIKQVIVRGWKGVGFPSWGMNDLPCLLPNLTRINITRCDRCRCLPTFSRLLNLKYLELRGLRALEYIEEGEERMSGTSTTSISEAAALSSALPLPYFPSLARLSLFHLSELKGWSRIHLNIGPNSLPRLRVLWINKCPKLKTMCVSPRPRIGSLQHLSNLQRLSLRDCDNLDLLDAKDDDNTSFTFSGWQDMKNLRYLRLKGISGLKSLPKGLSCLTTLQKLLISNLPHLEGLPEWIGQLTQLHQLCISFCSKLSEFPESIGSLTTLTHLYIWDCKELKKRYEKPNGEGWPLIQHIPNVCFYKHEDSSDS